MVKYFASIIRQLDLLRSQRESERKLRNCLYPSCKFEALGFTLIELVVVVAIISIATLLISINSGALAHWEEENFLRRLIETIEFLHSQAIQDGEHYRIEFNFEENSYRVGILKTEDLDQKSVIQISQDAGALSLELATVLSPALGRSYSLIPPPAFPSLAEPTELPAHLYIRDVRNLGGLHTATESSKASLMFSPRGFSEFGVIHLADRDSNSALTILVNPFTGLAQLYRDDREFEWTYGRPKK